MERKVTCRGLLKAWMGAAEPTSIRLRSRTPRLRDYHVADAGVWRRPARTCLMPRRSGAATGAQGSILLVAVALCCLSCATGQPPSGDTRDSSASAAQAVASGESRGSSAHWIIPYYPPPSAMELCGEPVPLRNQEVMERFDKEFTLVVYNHAQVYLWLKRMERYFPWIEERLRAGGLPDDLKYVAVVESDLLPDACSPKGAAGPWQFMPATGSAYGLQQTGGCDERYDFERATECAFRYLQDLHRRYRNWTVAIATYNCGDKRVQEQIRAIGSADYYQMRLPTETERYILRILAVKAVLGSPGRYGYQLPPGQGYPPLKTDRVNVQLSCPLPLHAAAEASGSTVRELKRLNPALRSDEIPEGSYQLRLPAGSGEAFEKNIDMSTRRRGAGAAPPEAQGQSQSSTAEEAAMDATHEPRSPARERRIDSGKQQSGAGEARGKSSPAARSGAHTVKRGESLSTIAKRYNVSTDELRRANKLKSSTVSSGQKLVIP